MLIPSVVLNVCNVKLLKEFFFGYKITESVDSVDAVLRWNVLDISEKSNALAYKKKAEALLDRSYELLTSNEWVVEKVTSEGYEISYMNLPQPDGKIFKITGIVQAPAQLLLNNLFEDVDGVTKWNKNIVESRKLHVIDENTDIVYQATSSYGNIHPRDFVVLRHRGERDAYYISAGVSISSTLAPDRKNFIRGENGVNCWATERISQQEDRCKFTWIMNTKFMGWIPQKIVELTTSSILLNFMSSLKKYASTMRNSSTTK